MCNLDGHQIHMFVVLFVLSFPVLVFRLKVWFLKKQRLMGPKFQP